jgi:hypothetical protein
MPQVDPKTRIGQVSLATQWAPFDPYYIFHNTSDTYQIYDENTALNVFKGNENQESTSAHSQTLQDC